LIRKGLAVGVVLLFLLSSVMSVGIGGITSSIRVSPSEKTLNTYETNRYNIHRYPEGYFGQSSVDVQSNLLPSVQNQQMTGTIQSISSNGGPMDSPWPMYCHDTKHTGLSPYTTVNNPMTEKWRFVLSGVSYDCAPTIDNNGIIYAPRYGLYAINPNGTLKGYLQLPGYSETAPLINENGIIYLGTIWNSPNYLYSIYSNNMSIRWRYLTGNDITSSPAIGNDDAIYCGDWNGNIHAVYQNGTRKWMYHTGDVITSSPAIGDDGTIYIGSHDDYVYALHPNGTLKWRFQTGSWVHASPTIGPDGTVYIGSDDSYLYALNPNTGSMIWRCSIGGTWCSPTLGPDGTIYLGTWGMNFYAIRPNGTIKWTYTAPGRIWEGSSAALSSDGILYFGTKWFDGGIGAFIALNASDGQQRFIDYFGEYETSPAIAEDGTIYAVTSDTAGDYGILHAFGRGVLRADAGGPYAGYAGEKFTVNEMIYGGTPPYSCYWDFGDGNTSTERHPIHIYHNIGTYNITFTVTDSEHNTSIGTTTIDVTYGPPDATLIKPTGGVYVANIQIIPGDDGLPLIFGHITLMVNASHPVADIDHVEFLIDGKVRATDRKPPYQWVWRQRYLFKGFHLMTIVAVSTVGTSAERNYQVIKFF
jgi:outer membrane protein assembly factor BamB